MSAGDPAQAGGSDARPGPGAGPAPAQALASAGLVLPPAPAPLAAYAPTARAGSLLFTSGQLPLVDGALAVTGLVGDGAQDVDPARARELAGTCALNALAALAGALAPGAGDDERVAALARVRVVKVVGFVASAPGFTGQPGVVDGASTLLREVLGEHGVHARSAVGVAALPLGAPVEVELVAEVLPR